MPALLPGIQTIIPLIATASCCEGSRSILLQFNLTETIRISVLQPFEYRTEQLYEYIDGSRAVIV